MSANMTAMAVLTCEPCNNGVCINPLTLTPPTQKQSRSNAYNGSDHTISDPIFSNGEVSWQ